ncbi:flagellar basal body P-ring formation chaperone FlgA [Curvivirga aplysinae]|uniref:flagellar basal body P-ring formation chaperone FlgA n=1 Tax=Curvivirga aplysinae TaxID=2529852 RepID=UPI0012BD5552|nr:flagellar basal body P-ring formation chaperone FlgA [Curvivirga aplysinae]MTI10595.1 flagellar basal body P-ring formation protein FlgA [Curvivirga aplysinae]
MKKQATNKMIAAFLLGSAMSLGTIAATTNPSYANSEFFEIEQEVTLNHNILIQGENITLGDLFQNAGENAHRVVAKAPALGKSQKLTSSWLWRVANFYKLDWKPSSTLDEAIVERDYFEMEPSLLTDSLRNAIIQKTGESELLEIQLNGRIPTVRLPIDADMSVAIKNFRLSDNESRFTATYVVPATGKAIVKGKVSGKVHKLMEVALPNRRIQAGEILKQEDLEVVTMRARKVSRKAVVDATSLIGKQIRRTITPGRPILSANLQAPQLVKKKQMVLVTLESMGMRLTAQGVALEDGAHKEVIRIRNSHSGQVLEAIVTGYNTVTVRAPLQSAQM